MQRKLHSHYCRFSTTVPSSKLFWRRHIRLSCSQLTYSTCYVLWFLKMDSAVLLKWLSSSNLFSRSGCIVFGKKMFWMYQQTRAPAFYQSITDDGPSPEWEKLKYKKRQSGNTKVHKLPFKQNKQTSNFIMEETKRFSAAFWQKAIWGNFFKCVRNNSTPRFLLQRCVCVYVCVGDCHVTTLAPSPPHSWLEVLSW